MEDLTLDELRAKFEEMKAADSAVTPADGDPEKDFALEGQFRGELVESLESEKIETPWGMDCHYWFWDYDREASEVYATDLTDWNLYGFPYSTDGDRVVVDFKCKKRMKLAVVPFDEGSAAAQMSEMFTAVMEKFTAAKEAEIQAKFDAEKAAIEAKYQTAETTINQMNTELSELRQFKQDKLKDERAADEDAVFAMFPDLSGVEAFENLRKSCAEMSIDEIEDKCFAIRGRNTSVQNFSAQKPKAPRLPVEKSGAADEPYGGLFVEFPPNK